MLSSESLLLARNSGCLNSHACDNMRSDRANRDLRVTESWRYAQTGKGAVGDLRPYILAIRRLAAFFVVLSNLVEVILIELAHETGKVAMLEVLW
jgi:hypothetical protein